MRRCSLLFAQRHFNGAPEFGIVVDGVAAGRRRHGNKRIGNDGLLWPRLYRCVRWRVRGWTRGGRCRCWRRRAIEQNAERRLGQTQVRCAGERLRERVRLKQTGNFAVQMRCRGGCRGRFENQERETWWIRASDQCACRMSGGRVQR
jgi:hypothetical protein